MTSYTDAVSRAGAQAEVHESKREELLRLAHQAYEAGLDDLSIVSQGLGGTHRVSYNGVAFDFSKTKRSLGQTTVPAYIQDHSIDDYVYLGDFPVKHTLEDGLDALERYSRYESEIILFDKVLGLDENDGLNEPSES